ncbi:PREDICTED: pEARLI1-like lipid transfer protein 3 [Camelina sativa]|uniref:PEARLI1-like lipid transfer protein 3 n=1 Tax=Camelina sativa TaxID=90675 RepID=A0ABM0V0A3_CAMSA|nr:PREDICTED: pEARLI1-like lipid transfer protein 3 [Camelina sativa]
MASQSSTTISLVIILLISLAEADLLSSPSPTMDDNFGTCPRDPLQLRVCANVLGLANVTAGDTRARSCCTAINGLANVQVADCLCFIFRPLPLVFGIDKAVREIFFACNMVFLIGFQCPPSTVTSP